MKVFFSLVAVLMILLGSGWLFFPEAILASWSVESDPVGVYMARRYGGALFGYGPILWLTRTAGASPARVTHLWGSIKAAARCVRITPPRRLAASTR